MTQNESSTAIPGIQMPPRKSRSVMIFMMVALLGAGSYYYWINSPTYAVMELEKSIREKDLAGFYSRLDLDRIYDSSIDALTVIKSEGAVESPWESVQSKIGAGFTKVLKPQVMNSVKHEIELAFRNYEKEQQLTSTGSSKPQSPIKEFFSDIQTFAFGKLARTGEKALVNVDLKLMRMEKTYPLTLALEKIGEWKVTGFEGLSSTLTLFVKDQEIRVKAHNLKIQDDLSILLPFNGQVRQEDSMLGLGQEIHFEFLFQNEGDSRLKQLEGLLFVVNAQKEVVLSEPFARSDLNIELNEKKVFLLKKEIGVFGSKTVNTDGLALQFKFGRARFEDGKDFRIVNAYNEL